MILTRTTSSFQRKKATYLPQMKVLVVCEDSKSCKSYLEDAAQYFRASATVSVVHMGNTDPRAIVRHAIKEKPNFASVFCVVDRDRHHHWDSALRLAADNGVNVICSYPCYEFWLLLHFTYTRRGYVEENGKSPGEVVAAALRRIPEMQDYSKGKKVNLFEKLLPHLPTAIANARRAMHEVETDQEPNPSTKMHEILGEFEALSKPLMV